MTYLNARLLQKSGLNRVAVDSLIDLKKDADEAAESSSYGKGDPASYVARSDPAGVFPAGNPATDLTMNFYDPDGAQIAQRVLRGTLTTSAGTYAVTNVSSSGLTTSYALTGDGTDSVRADVQVTLASGKVLSAALTWNAIDNSSSGGTPSAGGGK